MRSLVLVGCFAVVVVVSPRPARACCDDSPSGPAMSPRSGAVLPANPSLFLWLGRGVPTIEIAAGDRSVPFRVVEIPDSLSGVVRVDVEYDAAGELTVRYGESPLSRATYRVDPELRQAHPERFAVDSIEYVNLSYTRFDDFGYLLGEPRVRIVGDLEGFLLRGVTPAVAYHVEWARSREDFDTGVRHHLVLSGFDHSLMLGTLGCEWSIPRDAFDAPIYVDITALYSDGSEARWDGPHRIGPSPEPLLRELWEVRRRFDPADEDDALERVLAVLVSTACVFSSCPSNEQIRRAIVLPRFDY